MMSSPLKENACARIDNPLGRSPRVSEVLRHALVLIDDVGRHHIEGYFLCARTANSESDEPLRFGAGQLLVVPPLRSVGLVIKELYDALKQVKALGLCPWKRPVGVSQQSLGVTTVCSRQNWIQSRRERCRLRRSNDR